MSVFRHSGSAALLGAVFPSDPAALGHRRQEFPVSGAAVFHTGGGGILADPRVSGRLSRGSRLYRGGLPGRPAGQKRRPAAFGLLQQCGARLSLWHCGAPIEVLLGGLVSVAAADSGGLDGIPAAAGKAGNHRGCGKFLPGRPAWGGRCRHGKDLCQCDPVSGAA